MTFILHVLYVSIVQMEWIKGYAAHTHPHHSLPTHSHALEHPTSALSMSSEAHPRSTSFYPTLRPSSWPSLFFTFFIQATIPAPLPNPGPLADIQAVRWFDMNIICRFVLGYVLFVNGSSIVRQLFFFNCKSHVLHCLIVSGPVRLVIPHLFHMPCLSIAWHVTWFVIDSFSICKQRNLLFTVAVLCYLYATGIGKFIFDFIAKSFLPPERGKLSVGEERRGEENGVAYWTWKHYLYTLALLIFSRVMRPL